MALAFFYRKRRAELRADFQEHYGLNLDLMGKGYTIRHAADLAVMLPSRSRTFVAIDPSNAWGLQERVLARIEYWCHVAAWMQTRDGQKGRNAPKPLFDAAAHADQRRKDAVALDVADYAKVLSKPRKEAAHGD